MNGQRHVIVGAGPAGLNAAEVIRSLDRAAKITLVSDEPAYSRMALPYFLSGQIERDHLLTGGEGSFSHLGVELRLGAGAEALHPEKHTLRLSNGQDLTYDKLLLATGSSPLLPPIPGLDLPGVHTFWTLEDAEAVLQSASGKPEVLMIGAGFVGFTVLTAMHKRGWRLHVVEMLSQILPRMLDGRAATMAASWLGDRGVEVMTDTQVTSIERTPAGRKLVQVEGAPPVEVDLVIAATGVIPNRTLAESAGLDVDHGVLVDAHLRTSHPDVFAAGDVAQGPDLLTGYRVVHAIQPTATDHGRIAGANMAGQAIAYPGSLSMNILDVAGLHCVSIGAWGGEDDEIAAAADESRSLYRKLVWRDGQLIGAILIGPSKDLTLLNDVGMAKGLIQSRADLGAWRHYLMANPWDVRRPFTAARIAERLLGQTLLAAPSAARLHRYRDLQPERAPRPTHAQLLKARPERLTVPIPAPPLR